MVDREGRVLIAQRPTGKWQAGRWEFPGGKLEAGEDEQQALRRELEEELGIHVQAATRVLEVAHDYPDRSVVIALWLVLRYDGTPTGLDGQALRWVEPRALAGLDLLEADLPMLPALLGALGLAVPR